MVMNTKLRCIASTPLTILFKKVEYPHLRKFFGLDIPIAIQKAKQQYINHSIQFQSRLVFLTNRCEKCIFYDTCWNHLYGTTNSVCCSLTAGHVNKAITCKAVELRLIIFARFSLKLPFITTQQIILVRPNYMILLSLSIYVDDILHILSDQNMATKIIHCQQKYFLRSRSFQLLFKKRICLW